MFGLAFLSPLFLAGAVAAAIPVLLHLFHRRADPLVPFAAMRYLRSAPVEQARHRRLKEWLLLALRVTALLLLALAFARPYIADTASALGAPAMLVVVDTSASLSAPGQFERARARAAEVVRGTRLNEQVGVMTSGISTDVRAAVGAGRAEALEAIRTITPGAGATRYRVTLARAAEAMGGRHGRIVLVTDLQESGWDSADDAVIPAGIDVEVADIGAADRNLAVTALRVEDGDAVATVQNFSSAMATANTSFAVDDSPVGAVSVTVAPGATSAARVSLNGKTSGALRATVADPAGYAADNSRYTVLDTMRGPSVLVVSTTGAAAEALYLERALSTSEGATAFRTRLVSGPQFSNLGVDGLRDVDAVIVLGTRGIEHQGRQQLGEFVRGGGGVLVATGPGVDAAVVKEALSGIALTTWRERGTQVLRFAPEDSRHPIFRPFRGMGTLANVTFGHATVMTPAPAAAVIARYSDGSPALIDEPAGRGRVLVFGSDLNHAGNDLPLQPAFVPFVHEAVRYLAASRAARSDYVVGELPGGIGDVPGVVQVAADAHRRAAVNVDPRESNPARLTVEAFRADVARLKSGSAARAVEEGRDREDRYRFWQYALVAMVLSLATESVIGRRLA